MKTRWVQGAAVAVALLVLWLVFRSPYRNVVNLNAPGATIVVLGDSVPAGFGCTHPESAWPNRMATALMQPVVNASVVGDTTANGLARLNADVLSKQPRLVIVELGGNDFMQKVGTAVVGHNLESLFKRIQATGAMAMFLSVPTLGDDYQQTFKDTADRCGVYYVSNILSGIMAHPDLMSDMIHPSDAGHERIWQRLSPEIRGLLKAGNSARR